MHREIRRFLVHKTGVRRGQTGAATLVQRFGSAANLNIHLHGLVLDGDYQSGKDDPVFHPADAPTPEELDAILQRIIHALMKQLTRSGHLHVEEEGTGYLSDLLGEGSADPGLSTLQWASCTYRIAFGPNAGRSILRRQDTLHVADTVKPGCVLRQGFSLHAGIRCRADQRRELERLCHYITRPALSHERVAPNARLRREVDFGRAQPFRPDAVRVSGFQVAVLARETHRLKFPRSNAADTGPRPAGQHQRHAKTR